MQRVGVAIGAVVAIWIVAAVALPQGAPVGVVALGLVSGALYALTALGLVLIYRANRIVNFAQAEIGGLASTVAVLMVAGAGLPYLLAVPVGLVAAAVTGLAVEAVVVRRFAGAPRLIFTVATIGVAQLLGAAELGAPSWFGHLRPFTRFHTPFRWHLQVGPALLNGDHFLAVAAALAATAALAWFLLRTDAGVAIRGVADSTERALLLGVPVRSLSRLVWVSAAGLSGVAAILATPINGVSVGVIAGPTALLPPLTAAVVGRMSSLPRTLAAALALGVFRSVTFWSYPRSSFVDVAELGIILLALLAQRSSFSREVETSSQPAVRPVRPLPTSVRRDVRLRIAGAVGLALGVAALVALPWFLNPVDTNLLGDIAIYAVVAVSLVVLVGWSGQISLGQFAFVGVGAGITGGLIVNTGADLFVALLAAAAVGAIVAVVVGLPAVRVPGLLLAVVTLAFAVPVSSYVLSSTYFPKLTPALVVRPALLHGRIDLAPERAFYFFCLGALAVVLAVAHNVGRSRVGRAIRAVRENERAASSLSISAFRMKLLAFGLSGAMAGLAGGLYVLSVRGIGFGAFNPEQSLAVFTMVVVGGLGSIPGALLGAAYVELVQYFLRGALQLLATGAGLLVLLMVIPGGLGEIAYRGRDWLVARLLGRPLRPDFADTDADAGAATGNGVEENGLLTLSSVDAAYGRVRVVNDVDMAVGNGDVLALLGTNGAGKSTLLRVIAGLVPTKGRVRFADDDITELDPAGRVRRGIAMVPGGRGVFPSLTVAENLRVGGWTGRRDATTAAASRDHVLSTFPALRNRLDAPAGALSGGEQQMLAIAMALLSEPKILLIDELSLGLAPIVVNQLVDIVRDLNRAGVTVVIVEQSLNVAAELAPRAVFLERGRVRFTGETSALAGRSDLARAVFLAPPPRRRQRTRPSFNGASALAVEEVSMSYGGVAALDAVSLEVRRGEIAGLIGANGAGKTTLLDVCSGFETPRRGRIRLRGLDVTSLGPDGRAERGLGRIFQDARLFPALTVRETIAVARERFVGVREPIAAALRLSATVASERDVWHRVDELLELLNLERWQDAFISELSTGTRRIVEIACLLAHEPSVLLLDEPTSGLAQREGEALAEVLRDIRAERGMTMLIVEHDIPLVAGLADTLWCMHAGAVIATGAPADVLADPAVVTAYLGEPVSADGRRKAGRARAAARR